MPRSDKIYIMITVGLASVFVIASIVATILTLTGDKKERPAYESAPAKALTRANPVSGSIVNVENAERPPISDEAYLILHRETRLLTRELATGKGWRQRAYRDGMSTDGLLTLSRRRASLFKGMQDAKVRRKIAVTVYRPTPPSNKNSKASYVSRTVGSVSMISKSGERMGSLRNEIFWQQVGNLWQIQDIVLQLDLSDVSGGGPTNPVEEGSVEAPAEPDDPASEFEIPGTGGDEGAVQPE